MSERLFNSIPGMDHEEYQFLEHVSRNLREDQFNTFVAVYNGKRIKSEMILVGGLLGLFAIAGVQRFMLNQIGMGILYLLTGGLCLIGTIVDLVNYKKLTFEYNQSKAYEALDMTKSIKP